MPEVQINSAKIGRIVTASGMVFQPWSLTVEVRHLTGQPRCTDITSAPGTLDAESLLTVWDGEHAIATVPVRMCEIYFVRWYLAPTEAEGELPAVTDPVHIGQNPDSETSTLDEDDYEEEEHL